jgi:hypothetical protein
VISLPNKVKGPALGEGGGESFTPSCTRACAPQAWLINYALSELLIKAVFKVYFAEDVFLSSSIPTAWRGYFKSFFYQA